MGKKGGGKKKKGGGEALRGAPPEDECQDLEEIRESGFTMYESLEQQQFNATAPAYMKALYRKEQDALRALEEAENEGAPLPSQKQRRQRSRRRRRGGEVVADA